MVVLLNFYLFLVEMVSDPQSRRILIGPDPPEQKPHVPKKWWQRIWPLSKLTAYRRHHHHEEELGSQPNGTVVNEEAPSIILPSPPNGTLLNEEAPTIITVPSPEPSSVPEESALGEEALETEGNSSGSSDETGSYSLEDSDVRQDNRKISHVAFDKRKWMTPWYWQFLVLVHRSFKLSWHQIITKLKIFQVSRAVVHVCTEVTSLDWPLPPPACHSHLTNLKSCSSIRVCSLKALICVNPVILLVVLNGFHWSSVVYTGSYVGSGCVFLCMLAKLNYLNYPETLYFDPAILVMQSIVCCCCRLPVSSLRPAWSGSKFRMLKVQFKIGMAFSSSL